MEEINGKDALEWWVKEIEESKCTGKNEEVLVGYVEIARIVAERIEETKGVMM